MTDYYREADAAREADHVPIVLHSDQIWEIRDSGCQVYDEVFPKY